ncbi:MAG: hypothetical protein ACI9UN_004105 [Granulosicoccus sp.]|jgi:hypothetical protein
MYTKLAKGQEVQKVAQEVVVVATKQYPIAVALISVGVTLSPLSLAKILPEDRADVLWHSYSGDNVTIEGPSVLVRKAYKDKISAWGNYYVDMISGASVDVEATASAYAESREEVSLGMDYLYDKTMLGVGITTSKEDDYEASTLHLSISQDFFGDLTTVSMGYSYGDDTVKRNGDDIFEDSANHQAYKFELSQILTKHMIMNLGYEAVVDEGFLNNPYRSVRFSDSTAGQGYSYQAEIYPRTRTSDAIAVRSMYYLPYRAALRAEYRYYSDSWGIVAHNAEVSYTHPLGDRWEFDAKARFYTQTAAEFYADIFPFRDAQNFLARDKELATFDSATIGLGVSYLFSKDGFLLFDKGSVNLNIDYVTFDYQDFSDVTSASSYGNESLFNFNAIVLRAFVSLWF